MARTAQEMQGAIVGLEMALTKPELQLYLKEIERLKEDLLSAAYMAKGEEAIRCLGIQQGMALCMHIVEVLRATSNIGNKGIIKP